MMSSGPELRYETITISRSFYEKLLNDSELLAHLHAAGVDNWDGYTVPFDDENEDT